MTVDLLTDRQIISQLLEAGSELLFEEELIAFASMNERMASEPGANLTDRQRQWAEEVFARAKLDSPKARARRKAKDPDDAPLPAHEFWWERPENRPLKPPTGTPWPPR